MSDYKVYVIFRPNGMPERIFKERESAEFYLKIQPLTSRKRKITEYYFDDNTKPNSQ